MAYAISVRGAPPATGRCCCQRCAGRGLRASSPPRHAVAALRGHVLPAPRDKTVGRRWVRMDGAAAVATAHLCRTRPRAAPPGRACVPLHLAGLCWPCARGTRARSRAALLTPPDEWWRRAAHAPRHAATATTPGCRCRRPWLRSRQACTPHAPSRATSRRVGSTRRACPSPQRPLVVLRCAASRPPRGPASRARRRCHRTSLLPRVDGGSIAGRDVRRAALRCAGLCLATRAWHKSGAP